MIVDQLITINDVTIPTASNPVAINVECISDVPAPDITAVSDETDNCTASPAVVWVGDVSDGNTCPEVISRTYSVTDDCGNFITVTQTITVNDVTAPLPDVVSLSDFSHPCSATPASPTATDNCSGLSTGIPDVTFPITTQGTTIVTWTYTDNCGNSVNQTQNVFITGAIDVSTSVGADGVTITAANSLGTNYTWIDCDNGNQAIPGETSQSFIATSNGSYAVIIDEGGCIDTSSCVAISTIGLEEEFFIPISLYPNPTVHGEFVIKYDGTIISVTVSDALGRIVEVPVNLGTGEVNVSQVQTGSYWVNVTTETGSVVKALLIYN